MITSRHMLTAVAGRNSDEKVSRDFSRNFCMLARFHQRGLLKEKHWNVVIELSLVPNGEFHAVSPKYSLDNWLGSGIILHVCAFEFKNPRAFPYWVVPFDTFWDSADTDVNHSPLHEHENLIKSAFLFVLLAKFQSTSGSERAKTEKKWQRTTRKSSLVNLFGSADFFGKEWNDFFLQNHRVY